MIKFSIGNWERFKTHAKRTTIRTHELKVGFHAASNGRYNNYRRLGDVYVHACEKKCKVSELNFSDARSDGFDSLTELIIELAHLNKELTAETIVYQHRVEVLEPKGGMSAACLHLAEVKL